MQQGPIRQLKTALRWEIPAAQRQRIQMVLLRESGMAQPAIASAMGVSLSTVNRAHMAYDHADLIAQAQGERRTPAREHGGDRGEGLAGALRQGRRAGEMLNIHDLKAAYEQAIGTEPATAQSITFWPGIAGAN